MAPSYGQESSNQSVRVCMEKFIFRSLPCELESDDQQGAESEGFSEKRIGASGFSMKKRENV